jgi:dihydroorotase-like cyclic amidohydrolase
VGRQYRHVIPDLTNPRHRQWGSKRATAVWQLQSKGQIGSIEVGKYANLIIIDQDPHTVNATEIANTQVIATYFADQLVYKRANYASWSKRLTVLPIAR